jgi:serine/threonine protein kinase
MWSFGMTLGRRYELEERVGTGGFSEVWRANDLVLGRPVAIKLLHAGYIQDAEALARFKAEARHAAGLAHENIARVYDYSETDPPYLVMELVEGPSLERVLTCGPLDPLRVMDLIAQAATGLQTAHLAGLVHRDIKPANLLTAPGGIVKITDFGIAQTIDSTPLTRTGLVVGTAGYLAPERASGATATEASDLYSLGVVAYECLTGGPPFSGSALEVALAHVNRPFPALPESVPPDVAALVLRLTAKDPAARPASAGEVAREARQIRGGRMSGSSVVPGRPDDVPADESQPPEHRSASVRGWSSSQKRRGAALAGVAGALIVLVALAGWSLWGSKSAGHPVAVPSSSTSAPSLRTVVTVDVDATSLIGQPVAVVVSQLRQQKLIPRVVWQPTTDQQQNGLVTGIQPAGQVPVGSTVTVVVARAVPPSPRTVPQASTPNGDGNDQGGDESNGNGNGNGNGSGKHKGKGNS